VPRSLLRFRGAARHWWFVPIILLLRR
jgi:hypothetical protein